MRLILATILLPISLGGCLAYTETPAPPRQAVVVPAGTTVVTPAPVVQACANGLAPPCY